MPYITIKNLGEDSFEEKKSEFIGYAKRVESEEEAKEFVAEIKNKHKQARHNCWAYIVGENMSIQRYSDDGEPQGTAGIPILEVMKKQGITDCAVVVTRYFGGILLGTGGLVRAYSDSLINAIKIAKKQAKILGCEMFVELEYTEFEKFKYYCRKNNISIKNVNYLDNVTCNLELEEDKKAKLMEDYNNKSINLRDIKFLDKKLISKSIIK